MSEFKTEIVLSFKIDRVAIVMVIISQDILWYDELTATLANSLTFWLIKAIDYGQDKLIRECSPLTPMGPNRLIY